MKTFTVEERYNYLSEFTTMVAKGLANSCIITGEGGLGKTFTTVNAIEETGVEYVKISGYSTPRGLFETLYDNNGKLLLFDDCDSVLEDKVSQNILKIALDSNDERIVSWASRVPKGSSYPKEFEYTGRIIFISNLDQSKIPQALLTRGFKVDLTMTFEEKIERLHQIYPYLAQKYDVVWFLVREAVYFLEDNKEIIKSLSLRTLIDVIKIIKNSDDWTWMDTAKYAISQ